MYKYIQLIFNRLSLSKFKEDLKYDSKSDYDQLRIDYNSDKKKIDQNQIALFP